MSQAAFGYVDGDEYLRLGFKGRRDWTRSLASGSTIVVSSKNNRDLLADYMHDAGVSKTIIVGNIGALRQAAATPLPIPVIATPDPAPTPIDTDDMVAANHPLKELEATW